MIELTELSIPIKSIILMLIFWLLIIGIVFISGCIEKRTTYGLGNEGIVKRESWVINP